MPPHCHSSRSRERSRHHQSSRCSMLLALVATPNTLGSQLGEKTSPHMLTWPHQTKIKSGQPASQTRAVQAVATAYDQSRSKVQKDAGFHNRIRNYGLVYTSYRGTWTLWVGAVRLYGNRSTDSTDSPTKQGVRADRLQPRLRRSDDIVEATKQLPISL